MANTNAQTISRDVLAGPEDFSLVLGGPLFQLWRRVHLQGDGMSLLARRSIILAVFCWVPLLILSTVEGRMLPGTATIPFLLDLDVHIRFLVALPLLIAAERVVHERILPTLRQFNDRGLVPLEQRHRFDEAVAAAMRLRNSVLAEVLLIALVYGVGVLVVWRHYTALDANTWYATPSSEGSKLSIAGAWFGYVSLPGFQFLLVRWYFRLFIWGRLLFHISRIPLNIVPTHPDKVGGLGFLAASASALMPIAVAHGALVAGHLSGRILHLGAKLTDFKPEIGSVVVAMLLLALGPLLVFAPQLSRAKRTGRREYDALAQRYVREFDQKWLRGGAPPDEPFVGSGDIQSLADLGNSLEVVRGMRVAPITRNSVLEIGITTLLPVAPLLLTMVPIDQLLKMLLGLLF
ncbi:MAG TPA: hypothetical protein VJV78_36530 [Polyangiales bacterium]|nr:hypothetical protein [Polyangiales bacterium]